MAENNEILIFIEWIQNLSVDTQMRWFNPTNYETGLLML